VSDPIKVGDLVVVVRPTLCCNDARGIGKIFTVIGPARSESQQCSNCRRVFKTTDEVTINNGFGIEKRRLKRIPPLSELEGEKREEEISA
jgi:hypothetical protein